MEKLGINWIWLATQCLNVILLGLFIAGIVLFCWWLIRRTSTPPLSATATRETPLDILKVRYARGELTKEQFEQMRSDLES